MLKRRWVERFSTYLGLNVDQRWALTRALRYVERHHVPAASLDRLLQLYGLDDASVLLSVLSDFVDGPKSGLGSTPAALRFIESRYGARHLIVRLLRIVTRAGDGARNAPRPLLLPNWRSSVIQPSQQTTATTAILEHANGFREVLQVQSTSHGWYVACLPLRVDVAFGDHVTLVPDDDGVRIALIRSGGWRTIRSRRPIPANPQFACDLILREWLVRWDDAGYMRLGVPADDLAEAQSLLDRYEAHAFIDQMEQAS